MDRLAASVKPGAHYVTPVEHLASISADSASAFQALRKSVMAAGPLDHTTCELVVIATMAVTGAEASFKVHARRLLKEGVDLAAMRHAVLVTMAASTTFSQVSAALRWLDEAAV